LNKKFLIHLEIFEWGEIGWLQKPNSGEEENAGD